MPDVVGQGVVVIFADMTAYETAMGTAPQTAQDSAAKVSGLFSAEFTKVGRAATTAARQVSTEFGRLGSDFTRIVVPITNVANGIGGIDGAALGAAAAVTGIGVATLSAAEALDKFIEGTDKTLKRLDAISGAPPLPEDTIKSLDDYRQTSLGAEVASDRLRAQVAGLAAAAFEPAKEGLTGLLVEFNKALPTVQRFTDNIGAVQTASRSMLAILTVGVSEVARYAVGFDDLAQAGRDAADGLEDTDRIAKQLQEHLQAGEKVLQIQEDAMTAMTGASQGMQTAVRETERIDKATQEYVATLDLTIPEEKALADAAINSAEVRKKQIITTEEATEAEKAHRAEMQAAARAEREVEQEQQKHQSATRQLQGIYDQLNQAMLGPAGQIQANLDAEIRKITELGEASGNAGNLAQQAAEKAAQFASNQQTQLADATKFALQDAEKYWNEYPKQVEADMALVTETIQSEAQKQKRAMTQAGIQEAEAFGQTTANVAGNYADLENSIVAGYQAREDAVGQLNRHTALQANEAIANAEAAQIAQAGITAAITAASGIASLQTSGVPPWAAIPLGIAEGASLFAATVAGIRQHRPINFTWKGEQAGAHQSMNTTGDSNGDGAIDAEDQGGAKLVAPGSGTSLGRTRRDDNGSTQRGSRTGLQVEVKVRQGRVGKLPRRGGRA